MCARFELTAPAKLVAEIFPDDPWPDIPWPEEAIRGEYRPTNKAPTRDMTGRWKMLEWGLPAPWDGKPIINARAEGLADKPTFQPYLGNRLAIPATAFFEWRTTDHGKLKNRIAMAGHDLFLLAGFGSDHHFIIITCPPSPAMAPIHNRMPVMMNVSMMENWLAGAPAEEVLLPFAGELAIEESRPRQASLF